MRTTNQVLFKQRHWPGLADGSITVAFRRWRRPTVGTGGTLQTPAGLLAIDRIEPVALDEITDEDAHQAGYGTPAALRDELAIRPDGILYRIEFHRAGPDPREALRERTVMPAAERSDLQRRLARLDAASRHGPWTFAVLRLIVERPGQRAAELAASVGRETPAFKIDVRKLKNLGLTESLGVGYRISPRGRALLDSPVD